MKRFLALIGLLCVLSAHAAPPVSRLVWNGVPLKITMPINDEIALRLPAPAEVGLMSDAALSVQSVGNVVLLRATQATKVRVALRSLSNNQMFLIDVTASRGSPIQEYVLSLPDPIAPVLQPDPQTDMRVALTRFAAREFYAPNRLRGGLRAVRVPVSNQVMPLYRGASMETRALAAWQHGRYFVTAISVRNLTRDYRDLDPRQLRGEWLSATFQHTGVGPAGTDRAHTLLYLVSTQPVEASL
jgi:integrating conjugative element protein (TIGR03749 family)